MTMWCWSEACIPSALSEYNVGVMVGANIILPLSFYSLLMQLCGHICMLSYSDYACTSEIMNDDTLISLHICMLSYTDYACTHQWNYEWWYSYLSPQWCSIFGYWLSFTLFQLIHHPYQLHTLLVATKDLIKCNEIWCENTVITCFSAHLWSSLY